VPRFDKGLAQTVRCDASACKLIFTRIDFRITDA
jgi:hypothetical protein